MWKWGGDCSVFWHAKSLNRAFEGQNQPFQTRFTMADRLYCRPKMARYMDAKLYQSERVDSSVFFKIKIVTREGDS